MSTTVVNINPVLVRRPNGTGNLRTPGFSDTGVATVEQANGDIEEIYPGGYVQCVITPSERHYSLDFGASDSDEVWLQRLDFLGNFEGYDQTANLASMVIYLNGAVQNGVGWAINPGDTLRIAVVRTTPATLTEVRLNFSIANSQSAAVASKPYQWARWTFPVADVYARDNYQYDHPVTLDSNQPTGFNFTDYWAYSVQGVNVDDGEFSIEYDWLPVYIGGYFIGVSQNPTSGSALKYERMDAWFFAQGANGGSAGRLTAGIGFIDLYNIGGGGYIGIDKNTRQRIRYNGTQWSWEVMAGGQGAWVVVHTSAATYSAGTIFKAMFNPAFKGIPMTGIKLFGKWQ